MAYDFSKLKSDVKKTEEWLARELSTIRTGRATSAILDSVRIESFGTKVPINHVAGVSTEDARTIRVTPWDKGQIGDIRKGIEDANLGLSLAADDQGLRVIFPDLTVERREALKRLVNTKLEEARVTLRGHRDEAWGDIQEKEKVKAISKDVKFRLKEEMEKVVKDGNEALEAMVEKKEKEISQ
ncbi:MAG: ribosome recycling factor [Parcubacteria group bacterium]|nr:ribosome recycling factor [Parcubacteria group bacterium]